MRAVAISEYGAEPAVTELPDPEAGADDLLIKIQAAGVNPMDRSIASGAWQAQVPATFPMIIGSDLAGVVEAVGERVTRFSRGDEVFGQSIVAPLGSAGTYAEYVVLSDTVPLAGRPEGVEPSIAAALPTPGVTALQIVDQLEPLDGKIVVIVGAAGGVGSFATQLAAAGGARVIGTARAQDAERVLGYGADATIDHTAGPLPDALSESQPDGIDVLIDVASDADRFAALASEVRSGGAALTTRYVADEGALAERGVTGINFRVSVSPQALERVGDDVARGRVVPPPIMTITLNEVPAMWRGEGPAAVKTIVLP
jgi:NADPH:quinone reductase-like Zn-dependent oxidoreductase